MQRNFCQLQTPFLGNDTLDTVLSLRSSSKHHAVLTKQYFPHSEGRQHLSLSQDSHRMLAPNPDTNHIINGSLSREGWKGLVKTHWDYFYQKTLKLQRAGSLLPAARLARWFHCRAGLQPTCIPAVAERSPFLRYAFKALLSGRQAGS